MGRVGGAAAVVPPLLLLLPPPPPNIDTGISTGSAAASAASIWASSSPVEATVTDVSTVMRRSLASSSSVIEGSPTCAPGSGGQ